MALTCDIKLHVVVVDVVLERMLFEQSVCCFNNVLFICFKQEFWLFWFSFFYMLFSEFFGCFDKVGVRLDEAAKDYLPAEI